MDIAIENARRIARLAGNLELYASREDWAEVVDYCARIIMLAEKCREIGNEGVSKEWEAMK